ncbi:MAG: hypothetical protein MI922_05115, partial [Bacteroidales bacterium]|nr:hypothetical protein [Bacteroidales bacterium]
MTDETAYIERKKKGEDELDFESLKEQGIKLLQELSGKVWTDYNTHDPGVTILEQVIYALNELIYISEFDVKDVLTAENGQIPYKDLALYKPLEIFPSGTITHNDYCKSIFDNVEGIRNVWVQNCEEQNAQGLYCFLVDLEKKFIGSEGKIIEKIKQHYSAHRNLGEDIDKVEILKREPIELCAVIEINKNQTPDHILANIFFECFKVITPRIVFHSYKEMKDSDLALDDILTGPLTKNGYIKDDELLPPAQTIYVSGLMKKVFQVDGVSSIREFYIEKDRAKIRTVLNFKDFKQGAYIKFPENVHDLKIRLESNDRANTIDMVEVKRKFYQLVHKYKSTHSTSQDIEELFGLPKGKNLPLGNFYSIQNQFPAIYGVNEFGVPQSASPERKAKARQLKGYLLLFEQVMVNFLSQFENIPNLFSIDPDLKSTYFTKAHTTAPNVNDLYPESWVNDPEKHRADLEQLVSKYDNFYERRNRVLDYILALYGERFSQKTYQQFKYYYTSAELPQVLCENKIFFLKYLVEINRYKAGSFDYLKPSWNTYNISYLKLKTTLLLGIREFSQVTFSDVLANHNIQLIHEDMVDNYVDFLYKRKNRNVELDNDYIQAHFGHIPYLPNVRTHDKETISDIAKNIDYMLDGILCDEFFRYGINLNYYKIGKLNRRDDYTIVFKHPKYNDYIYIGDFKEHRDAVVAINCLQQFLVRLNQESEGVHILEHILLRHEQKNKSYGCHLTDHKNEVVFKSTNDYSKDNHRDFHSELVDVLHHPHNYLIVAADEERFEIYISKDDIRIFEC